MTVSTLTNRVVYIGNGSTTQFAVPFKVLDEDHLVVERRLLDTNEIDYTYIGTDYSYSGIGDDAGTLTLSGTALSSAYQLEIERVVPYTQELDIVNAGGFYPETVEEQLDLTTMQIQQIAAQADDIETRALMVPVGDEAPDYEDFAATFKGDPGGNAMAEGAFSTLAMRTVAVGINLILTLEYGTGTGVGGAFYVADVAVDAAYVTANPRTAKIDGGGRGWRLATDQTITPYMFGALGVSTFDGDIVDLNDDTAALQAFFDFCHVRRIESVNWGGAFGVTVGLIMGGIYGEANTHFTSVTCYEGSMLLGVKADITGAVLTNRARRQTTYGPLAIIGNGFDYADRVFDVGLLIEDQAQIQVWDTVFVTGARIAGLINKSTGADNTFGNRFNNCYFYACGSGSAFTGASATYKSANYSSRVNSGLASNTGQRTTMAVTVFPPASITSGTYGLPSFVRIGTELYLVTDYNLGAGTIGVYPWVDSGTAASGTLYYIFGAGFGSSGGDAGILSGKVASTRCSVGFCQGAQYPGNFEVTLQENAIGEVLGTGGAVAGGATSGYFEGNDIDRLWHASIARNSSNSLISETALRLARLKVFRPRRADNSYIKSGQPEGMLISWQGKWLRPVNPPDADGNQTTVFVYFDEPYGMALEAYADTMTVNISETQDHDAVLINNVMKDLFGYRSRQIHVEGTGGSGQPTGTITFNCIVGKTINGGGTSLAINAFTKPAIIKITIDTDTNYRVTVLTGK